MVGLDDVLLEIMEKLIGGELHRQVIPIVGMGGIGKTTLARNIYQNKAVEQRFDILVWVTISQEYRMREILLELLQEGGENLRENDECELGYELHKKLSGRRYLIMMDDIWDIEVWDKLKLFFPDKNDGSRIMITTRLTTLASQASDSHGIDMALLDEDNSWSLFSKIVFREKDCPDELVQIGKKIVKNCKGLPLSISVIGGLLAKSEQTRRHWNHIENDFSNLEDKEHCLQILYMSYNSLPVHLKPCFLYMGVFKEDHPIRVSMLIKLWVEEGFLKPINDKTLEDIAEEYLKDLISRNLILVHELGSTGSIKYCNIHDLLRDLCLREAQKERFYNVIGQPSLNLPQGINTQCRVAIPYRTSHKKALDALQSMPLARSLIGDIYAVPPSLRLLRILKLYDEGSYSNGDYCLAYLFDFVNLRFLAVESSWHYKFPSSVYSLWNLHTLIVKNKYFTIPAEIWNMPQLRHVIFTDGIYLPDPPSGSVVLGNLRTLTTIKNFKCGDEVVKRIPNINKLRVAYHGGKESSRYYLNNLERLHKLESFSCRISSTPKQIGVDIVESLIFPNSLKKLSLTVDFVCYDPEDYDPEDMLKKIGRLPLLEKLYISGRGRGSKGRKWETVDGSFPKLKWLKISRWFNLKYWISESSHFPQLKHLFVTELHWLEEIPSGIGEIPTLKSIVLDCCSDSAVESAKRIIDEQEELQGEVAFQVRVLLGYKNEEFLSWATPNFQVEENKIWSRGYFFR